MARENLMEDYLDYVDKNTPTYDRSNSTISFSHISKKLRRGSFFVHWDPVLEITPRLKKLEKSRLCLSQNEFSALEYQLYASRCLKPKKNQVYTYAGRTVEFQNDVYIKLLRYINVWNMLNLCIWRYHNEFMKIPSDEMIALFNTTYELEDEVEERVVTKKMEIKINDKYTLRRVFWTTYQRKAAANTRDHFLFNFERRYPMMSDLKWTETNNSMIREYILALMRAEVDIHIIHDICYEQLVKEKNEQLVKEKNGKEYVLETKDNPLEKTIEIMPMQRSSITDFSQVKEEVVAAIRLQRAYRKRLEKLKDAVRRIEIWWEPLRVKIIESRLEISQEMLEVIENLPVDAFEYKELVQEIKDDYKTTLRPKTRTNMYWIKVMAILAVPVALGASLDRWDGFEKLPLIVMGYVALQMLTAYRKLWKTMWFQTLALWFITAIIINSNFYGDGWLRIPVWIAVVALGRKYWVMLFIATLVIRIVLSEFTEMFTEVNEMFSLQPEEYYFFIYDFYCIATIAAASRQGTPIEMLHKVMINVVFLFVIVGSGIFTCLCVMRENL